MRGAPNVSRERSLSLICEVQKEPATQRVVEGTEKSKRDTHIGSIDPIAEEAKTPRVRSERMK
jgi:hypothetical protein